MVKVLRRIAKAILYTYLGVILCMAIIQRQLLYKPDTMPMASPAHYGLAAETVDLQGEAGKLVAWYAAPDPEKYFQRKLPPAQGAARSGGMGGMPPTILYFQGNGGSSAGRIHKFNGLLNEGFGLLALSYRGYSGSAGEPTEKGLYADARTALGWLKQKHPDMPVIYYGESLGSGIAVQLATEKSPALLVLEAPYTSVVDRAWEIYYWLPVPLLLRDRFESLDKINKVHAPLLVFHNSGDTIIPIAHGKAIYAAANAPKRAYWFKRKAHVDFDWEKQARLVKKMFSNHHSPAE